MTSYIIKRILLMIPTFALISLIIFLVLNLAPGRPGQTASATGTQTAESTEARESYRLFKEQFNFDKPILLNTRFGLTTQDVIEELEVMRLYSIPVCLEPNTPAGCLPPEDKPLPSRTLEAQESLEDWGRYIVGPLVEVANTHPEPFVRRLAVNQLVQNAQLRYTNEYGRKQTPEERQYNREVRAENNILREWALPEEATTTQAIGAHMEATWNPWFQKVKAERYSWNGAQKVKILLTDTRFAKYWTNLVTLNFGVSHVDKQPVVSTIAGKLKYSITLSVLSIFLAYLVSIPIGVWSAYYQNSKADNVVTVVLFMMFSLPDFFVAIVLLQLFTIGEPFQILPTGGFVGEGVDEMTTLGQLQSTAYHLILPVICLTYRSFASLSRYARTGVLDVIRADYIRTARAKGLSEPMVVIKHAVRNGMIPILTLLGTLLPVLIGGSVIIEVIFNIPGMGLYLFESISSRDYNAIMAVLLISTILTLFGLLVSDLSYAVVDPRISFD